MSYEASLIQGIAVMVALIGLALLLRRLGVVRSQNSGLFARLVFQFTLPALIFVSLARQQLSWDLAGLALVMMGAELVCIAAAWGAAQLLRLPPAQKGALILASGFGSSTLLGYALIQQIYKGNPQAMPDAVVISEIGVGTLIFTIGVLIAIHYGSGRTSAQQKLHTILKFFLSPIFIALVLGILVSVSQISTQNVFFSTLFRILDVVGKGNTVLVALVIGTLLQMPRMRSVLVVVAAACVIKLLLQPLAVLLAARVLGFPDLWTQILVLEAAMPSAVLSAVYSRRYGCDAGLASLLVVSTLLVSLFTLLGFLSLI